MRSLDIDSVRAFVLAAELESFTRAADALDTTQPAISVKLRRLEAQLGRRLLERTPRRVRLSAEGVAFLGAARELVATHDRAASAFDTVTRRLSVGISQHLVGGELPGMLRSVLAHDPQLRIDMRVAGSNDLMAAFERGDVDAALVLRPDVGRKRGRAVFRERFSWYAAPGWSLRRGEAVPLATQGAACRVRGAAVRALERAGLRWSEVFVGQGAAVVGAAAAAGLAVAVLAERAAPSGTVNVAAGHGLPPLPAQDVVLYSALTDTRSRSALRILTMAFHRGA